MLKSCKYCGRVHEEKQVCIQKQQAEEKRQKNRKGSFAHEFRKTNAWTKKSIEIRRRDGFLCLCCKAELPGTIQKYNPYALSVHHIVPIREDRNKRLDNGNLITVCDVHHEMCESGEISRQQQTELVYLSLKDKEEVPPGFTL